jgi:hypothetical protein
MKYKKKISFLIPTNRVFESNLNYVIDSIINNCKKYDFEICVFSENQVIGDQIVWYEEYGRQGPIYGFNKMAKNCNGEYIVCLTDDHILINDIDSTIDMLENSQDEFIITSLTPSNSDNRINPIKGELLGDKIIDFECKKYPLIRFPVIHKETFDKLGGVIFNEQFFYHAGDIWLGYYLGTKGFLLKNSPTKIVPKNPQKDPTYEVSDCNICRELIEKSIYENIIYNYIL